MPLPRLIFATNNQHKLEEVKLILSKDFEVLGLADINCTTDIPETGNTLEENALLKARFVKENYGYNCFADDTGLEVEALGNAPGVYSARYAGEAKSSEANIEKLLNELKTQNNKKAQFRTSIALIFDGKEYAFEGIIKGKITDVKKGESGFGYDPIFIPDGYEQTFAELGVETKNNISHRALAVFKLCDFLKNNLSI